MTRAGLPTPALVIDRPAFERNVLAMAAWARARGVALRPHARTHKSAEIAQRQLAAGAVGVCCAKLGEAEALAAEGVADILITSPVVSLGAVARLAALARRIRLAVVVDHPDNLARIAAAGMAPDVLIDIDPGTHRTGVTSADAAVALARAIAAAAPRLRYRGAQFFCGQLQHVPDAAGRRAQLAERAGYLHAVLDALATAGLSAATVTGGGTGSFAIDAELSLLNELQPGSYILLPTWPAPRGAV